VPGPPGTSDFTVKGTQLAPAPLSAAFSSVNANGFATKSGYCFVILLPDASSPSDFVHETGPAASAGLRTFPETNMTPTPSARAPKPAFIPRVKTFSFRSVMNRGTLPRESSRGQRTSAFSKGKRLDSSLGRRVPFRQDWCMIKSDRWIKQMALEKGMITPFEERQVRTGAISYGVSSYGYDIRIADEFKIFTNIHTTIVDPKAFDPRSFVDFKGDVCIIPPNSFALGRSVEYFKIPRNIMTITVGKSTYARCGIITNVTPFEPEWEGFVTLEISNTTPLPAKIYANEGIAQVLFFESDETCLVSYADRQGKYQGQLGIVLPRV